MGGSYDCTCNDGYTGDGLTCEAIPTEAPKASTTEAPKASTTEAPDATTTEAPDTTTEVPNTTPAPEVCTTHEKGDCVFPFEYRGTTYNNCTDTRYGGKLWCATAVRSNNRMKSWGKCDPKPCGYESCQTLGETKAEAQTSSGDFDEHRSICVFPFRYRYKTYNRCTKDRHTRSWCATRVTNSKYMRTWAHCDETK